jgi:hypothetical protein
MWEKCANNSVPKSPRPPLCFGLRSADAPHSKNVEIWQTTDLCTFECRACGVCHIEEGGASEGRLADPEAVLAA